MAAVLTRSLARRACNWSSAQHTSTKRKRVCQSAAKASRIVPRLQGPATDPRIDTQYIATEYGMCQVRGKSSTERALGLIEIAHPDFRDELTAAARAMHVI